MKYDHNAVPIKEIMTALTNKEPFALLMSDNEVMCRLCYQNNIRFISSAIKEDEKDSAWFPIYLGRVMNITDGNVKCCNCYHSINPETAYPIHPLSVEDITDYRLV